MEKENLRLYESFRSVPKEALKSFNNGKFQGTDINPMWRIKALTEQFGPCGEGWYFSKPDFQVVTSGDTMTVHCVVAIYYKLENGEWSQPVYGVGGNTISSVNKSGYKNVSDEAYKMAYTDACGIAAKQLGVGADVWFASDVTKYTQQQMYQQPQPPYQQQMYQPQQQPQQQSQGVEKKALTFDAYKAVINFFESLDEKRQNAMRAFYETKEFTNKPMGSWGPMEYDTVARELVKANKINSTTGVKIA